MRNIIEALDAYRGVAAPKNAPPVGYTGDLDADLVLAGYFQTLANKRGHRDRVTFLRQAVEAQEGAIDALHHQPVKDEIAVRGRRSHVLALGSLMAWLREIRGIDLDMAGQDAVEGRAVSA